MARERKPVLDKVSNTSTLDRDEYNKVVASAKLLTIQLNASKFRIDPEFHRPTKSRKLQFDYTAIEAHYDADEGAVIGRFQFACQAKSNRKRVLSVEAEYIVIYEVSADAEARAAEAFCDRVGIFAAYPYFRALAAHFAWAADADIPPLPVIATKGSPIRATTIGSRPSKEDAEPTR